MQMSPLTVARKRPKGKERVDPNREVVGSFWYTGTSISKELGVLRENEHKVLLRHDAVSWWAGGMSAPAFGDCKYDDDSRLVVFEGAQPQPVDVVDVVEAIVAEDLTEGGDDDALGDGSGVEVEAAEADGAQPKAVPPMGPPSSTGRRMPCPKVLEEVFAESVQSVSSAGGSSSATVVTDASASQSSALKRERDGDGKPGPPALDVAMECDTEDLGSGTTDPVPEDGRSESGDSDGQEGRAKRVRHEPQVEGALPESEAKAAMLKVQEQLRKDSAEWRSSFLGEDYKLQPKGRERGLEHPGDQATAVDSSGEHFMLEGIGHALQFGLD